MVNIHTVLLTGVYAGFKKIEMGSLKNNTFRNKEIKPDKLFLRKCLDSDEIASPFPMVSPEDIINRGYARTDLCTTITLTSILERNNLKYMWCNLALFMTEDGRKKVIKALKGNAPTVSLSTTFILNTDDLDMIISFIKRYANGKKIILGGALVGINPEITGKADYSVIGDGEETYPLLLKTIINNDNVENIKGVAYNKNGRVVITEPASIVDLNEIPPIDWKLATYHKGSEIHVLYEASRGCPYKCKYCTYHLNNKFRFKSAKKIFEEWKFFYSKCRINHIAIFDSVFSTPKERLKELCCMIVSEKLPVVWECWVRANDCQERELTDLMAKAGCKTVFFGVESASEEMLGNMDKKITIAQIEKAADNLTASGIITIANVMVGFPGETKETVRKTTEFLIKSRIFAYSGNVFQIRDKRMPILEEKERLKYGLKIGKECDSIPADYKGNWGEYWITDTITLQEAEKMFNGMIREVSGKGKIVFASILDYNKAAKIVASQVVDDEFFIEAVKAYERIAVLDPASSTFESDRDNGWKRFLTHYAILQS